MPASDHFRWNQKTLHIVFAASSILLLVSVILMMREDQVEPWREYQKTNLKLQTAVAERDLQALLTESTVAAEEKLQQERDEAQKAVDEALKVPENARLFDDLDLRQRRVEALEVELKSNNSIRDEAASDYNLAIAKGQTGDVLVPLQEAFARRQAVCDEIQRTLDVANAELEETKAAIRPIIAERDRLQADLDKLTTESKRVQATLDKIRPTSAISKAKRAMMEMPVIDGFNSHLRIVQDWLPGLQQKLGMTQIARFDRCRSCHQNIDVTVAGGHPAFPEGEVQSSDVAEWVKEGKFPQPFATHSNPELFCTASSPHPVAKFGCTVCHDGQGSGTSFGNAEHTPNDPHVAEDWHQEYGYHPNHFWEYPMQPGRFAESTCIKCHHSVTELGVNPKFGASAPKVYQGYQLIQKYGCFGCHEMPGYDAGKAIGPDLRVEPQTAEEAARIAADPTLIPGTLRKVGPSLRHVASKTSTSWIAYWTEDPTRFRPTTRMPKFFGLYDHLEADELHGTKDIETVELAGIAHVLSNHSTELDLLKPIDGYAPDAERGKKFFMEKGCLACHQHTAVPGTTSEFGPNISDIHLKVNRNADNPAFSDWLYTWIREPQRHHAKTRMPQLFLDAYTDGDGSAIDPAADIAAFLLSQGSSGEYPAMEVDETELDALIATYLQKARFSEAKALEILATRKFPQVLDDVVGDETSLATADGTAVADAGEWHQRKLDYVGRKSLTRYGCYACHDIPGYEAARPIGVALHDWGRKDTSKLGFEHIEEFLHHHGEPAGAPHASTVERVEAALKSRAAETPEESHFESPEVADQEMAAAYFFDSLQHHGRPGFIWQKLRAPRSYDFMKTKTKGYVDRLRMPKFPFKNEQEIEAIATFILGMVAEPPSEDYVYRPDVREKTRIEGEFLLAKFNCTGCHMVELPKITFGADTDALDATELTADDHQIARDLLLQMRPPVQALTGEKRKFDVYGEETELSVMSFHGIEYSAPDKSFDQEDWEYGFDTWETLELGTPEESKQILPGSRILVPYSQLVELQPARGGKFAEWLVEYLKDDRYDGNPYLAWQSSPPPLYQEGHKVQTPWLYQFLLEPSQIRYTTVLRMPRFNMNQHEAMVLANYFAAVDDVDFPYQENGPTDVDYLAERKATLVQSGILTDDDEYLAHSWNVITEPTMCIKCHSVGGRTFKVNDPKKDIQGPQLNVVQNRLRADWVKLWIYKPTWITPYTSMPVNFAKSKQQFPTVFSGDADAQIVGARDALLNYGALLEKNGPMAEAAPAAAPAETAVPDAAVPEAAATDAAAGAEE